MNLGTFPDPIESHRPHSGLPPRDFANREQNRAVVLALKEVGIELAFLARNASAMPLLEYRLSTVSN